VKTPAMENSPRAVEKQSPPALERYSLPALKLYSQSAERIESLKLVKDHALQGREWLIPLVIVTAIVVVIFIAYNQLRQFLAARCFFTAVR